MLNVYSQDQCYLARPGRAGERGPVHSEPVPHESGQYEVRYFGGDSINGAGYVCRGLQGVTEGEHKICALEATATSAAVVIEPSFSRGFLPAHECSGPSAPGDGAANCRTRDIMSFCVGPECGEV